MKKYTNMTYELKSVTFEDGVTQFLMRGQSVESVQATIKVQPGIRITEVQKTKRASQEEPKKSEVKTES